VIRHGIRSGEVGLVPDGVIGVPVSKVVTVPVGPDHTYSIAPAFKYHKAASFWKYPTLIYGSRSPAVKSGSRIG
jgi:hypothetical protein